MSDEATEIYVECPREEEWIERFRVLSRKMQNGEMTMQEFYEEFMAIDEEFRDLLHPRKG